MKNSTEDKESLVSIIVPMYNEEKRIGKCIESLINQSYPSNKYEIVIVSDGCTDNSEEIVEGIRSSRPDIQMRLVRQENQGAGAARNFGVLHAKGEILIFIDADCKAGSDWIEEMVNPLLQCDVLGVQGAYKTEQRGITALFSQLEFEERYEKLSKRDHVDFVGAFSAAYRREVFERHGGFNTMLTMNEDVDFAFRVSRTGGKLSFNPRAVVYHQHPDTLGKYLIIKFWRGFWRTIVYNRFREKTFRDSYTPATLKLQVMLVTFLAGLLLLTPAMPFMLNIVFGLIVLNTVSMIGFTVSAAKKDLALGLSSIGFLWLRAIAVTGGSLFAAGHLLIKGKYSKLNYKGGYNARI